MNIFNPLGERFFKGITQFPQTVSPIQNPTKLQKMNNKSTDSQTEP